MNHETKEISSWEQLSEAMRKAELCPCAWVIGADLLKTLFLDRNSDLFRGTGKDDLGLKFRGLPVIVNQVHRWICVPV